MAVITLDDLVKDINLKKLEQGMYKAVKMDFSYVPRKEKSIIKLQGNSILSTGNVSFMIAPPGSGKSNVVEAVSAGAVNPECDALGFTVDAEKVLLIDTERVLNDLNRGLKRIKRRTGMEDEEILKKLDIFSFLEMDTVLESKTELEFIISNNAYDLVIIDGSADFVTSVNDEQESKSFWKWLISLANRKDFGVLLTIHPNPEEPRGKATGHLGSQGQKKAESVFNIFKSDDDKGIREITTKTPHGKVRNANDSLIASFTWSNEEQMFVSCDAPPRKLNKKDFRGMFKGLFEIKDSYAYGELCEAYMNIAGKSLSTAKRDIKGARDLEIIFENTGLYWYNTVHEMPAEEEKKVEDDLPF